jgi:hypothetical protein
MIHTFSIIPSPVAPYGVGLVWVNATLENPDSCESVDAFGFLNTGANATIIHPDIVAKLKLKVAGRDMAKPGMMPAQTFTFDVNGVIDKQFKFSCKQITSCEVHADFIIGMDLLASGVLTVDMLNKRATFDIHPLTAVDLQIAAPSPPLPP